MISLTLQGPFPSKKNAWRRGAGQRAYLPSQMQADIDALVIQARAALAADGGRAAKKGPPLKVSMLFSLLKLYKRDLDNMFTTVLDALQKAGVIEDDKHVVEFHAYQQLARTGKPETVEVEVFEI